MSETFKKLLEPGYIGKIRTRNRMVKMAAEHTWFPYNDGYIDPRSYDFFEAVARGGIGLIEVNWADPDFPFGGNVNRGWRIDEDRFIDGQAKLAEIIHKYGCPAFAQLHHSGPMMRGHVIGVQPVAASSLSKEENPRPKLDVARELTIPEIERIVDKFVQATMRYKKAGFDGVTINGGFAHFFNSFFSRAWNKRTDAYGAGSLENRTRVMVDVLKGIKQTAGQDFAVVTLFNGAEIGLTNGLTVEEGKGIAKIFEAAGADALHIRIEYYLRRDSPSPSTHIPDMAFYPDPPKTHIEYIDTKHHGAGGWVPAAAAIKREVSIPVIAVGRLNPVLGEQIIRDGKADFIYMNRRIFADPELPNKVTQDRLDDIAPCIDCLNCFDAIERGLFSRCPANPLLGKEKENEIRPAAKKKRVLVIGGGPGGMEAALVARQRGHDVTLYEKESRLGGSTNIATVINGTYPEDYPALTRYLKHQLYINGVQVKIGVTVDSKLVDQFKPDALVIATGGVPVTPSIAGIDNRHVFTGRTLYNKVRSYLRFFSPLLLRRLSSMYLPLGKRIVIIGGGIQGCQIAQFLVRRGRTVTILEPGETIGDGLVPTLIKPNLLNWLKDKGVTMLTGINVEQITDNNVVFVTEDGQKQTINVDGIIIALPLQPNTDTVKQLAESIPEVYVVGDCKAPGMIVDATEEGARIGRLL